MNYIVVHELVHLDIKNHGEEFKSKVRSIFSEADRAEKWFEENSAKLEFDEDF